MEKGHTSNMDMLICNKCFVPTYRGTQPFNITSCGHISCQNCLQQVEKQCPQCKQLGIAALPLKDPLVSKVAPFFVPFTETLEMLLKVDMFRSNQMKITMQRFRELDKKYEVLKAHYFMEQRKMKTLLDKYMNLKTEKEKLLKKYSEMSMVISQRSTSSMVTPPDSGIFMHSSDIRYSLGSLKSVNITPMGSVDSRKQYKTIDGFRIPKPLRSVDSRLTSENNSICSFKK